MGIYKRIILICGFLLIALVVTDLIVSNRTKKESQVSQSFKIIQEAASSIGNDEPKPNETPVVTAVPFAGYPKSYKNIPIPATIYTEAQSRYRKDKVAEVEQYIIDVVHRYYIYKDFLEQNKIPYNAQYPVTLKNMETDVPKMEELIEQNLVTYVDFAYIKARFRYAPEEERIQAKYGDIKAKARQILEQYQQQFAAENVDPASVVAAANQDVDLITINNNEGNRIETNYTPDKQLFFTDRKFNSFLFAQKQGKVSSLFTLHGKAGDEYAFVIVYPILVQRKSFSTIDDMLNDNLKYFKDY